MADPALGLLIAFAIGQLSLTLAFAFGRPCQDILQSASLASWWVEEDAEQQRRKQKSRLESWAKILPWWILGQDACALCLMAVAFGNTTGQGLESQTPFGLTMLLLGLVLRFELYWGSEETTVRATVLIFLTVTLSMCFSPAYLQPLQMLTRLALLEVVPEPKMYWQMQVGSIPVNVLVLWLKASGNATGMDFTHILVNEAVASISVALAHYKNDWAFSQQMHATMSAEKCAEEANSLSLAVQQLLSVTCDACASLSSSLHISNPSGSLLGVLKVKEGQILNRTFTDFVKAEDRQRFQSILDFSTTTPSSGLVHLVDNDQVEFKAKVFLVQSGSMGHFIGITKEGQDLPQDGNQGGQDMHFLLGQPSKSAMLSPSCAGCSISEPPDSAGQPGLVQQVHDVEELERISIVIDPLSIDLGFTVKSATFGFATLAEGKQQRLANLMEWLDPRWRQEIQNWIQEEVNLMFYASSQGRRLEGVELLTPGPASLAGDFSIKCSLQQEPEGDPNQRESSEDWRFEAEIDIQNFRYLIQEVDAQFGRRTS